MYLSEFKKYVENHASSEFPHSVEGPFSWRGSYDEVAFSVELNKPQQKHELLEIINRAYTEEFRGYKGGMYQYHDDTEVNFEYDYGSYSDGGYARNIIETLSVDEDHDDQKKMIKKVLQGGKF